MTIWDNSASNLDLLRRWHAREHLLVAAFLGGKMINFMLDYTGSCKVERAIFVRNMGAYETISFVDV